MTDDAPDSIPDITYIHWWQPLRFNAPDSIPDTTYLHTWQPLWCIQTTILLPFVNIHATLSLSFFNLFINKMLLQKN